MGKRVLARRARSRSAPVGSSTDHRGGVLRIGVVILVVAVLSGAQAQEMLGQNAATLTVSAQVVPVGQAVRWSDELEMDRGMRGGWAKRRLDVWAGATIVRAWRREEPRDGDSAAGPVLEVELSYVAN